MLYKFQGHSPKAVHQPWDGWVADNATVIGQVELGKQVSVWFGAVIRADNAKITLGNLTNVQEKLYGQVITQCKKLSKEEYIDEIRQYLNKSSIDEWRFENNYNLRDIPYIITYITTDILLLIDAIEHYNIVLEYLKKRKNYVPYHVFINIAQKYYIKTNI